MGDRAKKRAGLGRRVLTAVLSALLVLGDVPTQAFATALDEFEEAAQDLVSQNLEGLEESENDAIAPNVAGVVEDSDEEPVYGPDAPQNSTNNSADEATDAMEEVLIEPIDSEELPALSDEEETAAIAVDEDPNVSLGSARDEDNESLTGGKDAGSAQSISVNRQYSDVTGGTRYSSETWYKFSLSAPGCVQMSFDADYTSNSGAWNFRLYGQSDLESPLNYDKFLPGMLVSQKGAPIGLPAGTYYLFVSNNWNNFLFDVTYRFTVNYTASSVWEREQNDNAGGANVISLNTTYYGSDAVGSGEYGYDWFRIALPQKSKVNIVFGGYAEHAYWNVYLYSQRQVGTSSTTASYYVNASELLSDKVVGTLTLNAGTYYICISNNHVANQKTYHFRVSSVTSPFIDVTAPNSSGKGGTAHYDDIVWMYYAGVSQGWSTSKGRMYKPLSNVARADMAAFLYRLAGSPSFTPSASDKAYFSDVTSDTPHAKEIWWLARRGISTGWVENGVREFRPYDNVARADMAAFLYRLAGSPSYTPSANDKAYFTDVTTSTPHAKEIWWMAHQGISTGWTTNGKHSFKPYSKVARADMAAFLHRMYASGYTALTV